jgi:NADH:ubiquinone oxidoreductase subunit D/NADH:ubiquinone oxidoreductase subunit B-like Fe-S oxidoreductase/NADH:ubiquinone oxidoreductase subunit C
MENPNKHIDFLESGPLAPFKKWSAKWSLWPCHFITSCCGVELAHAFACGYDGERLGTLNLGIARQSNFIIIEGTISRKMARALQFVYGQMPDPKFVNVIGACGERGGIFWNSYNITHPSDIVPVDFFVPGCPITPEGLLRGVRALQDKITGVDKTTIEFSKVELPFDQKLEERLVPTSPKVVAPTPEILVNIKRAVDWDFGKGLVETLKKERKNLFESITITGVNRIAVKTAPENLEKVAEVLKGTMKLDHVKSVNVIQVPHERKFIVEYMTSSYSDEALMPVLITIFTEIGITDPKIESLMSIWESANYSERELHEFFGVWFEGNNWMGKKFLLAPDTPDLPLRKEYKVPEERYVFEKDVEPEFMVPIEPPKDLYTPIWQEFIDTAHESDEIIVPIGPHHAGSGHLRVTFRVKGDRIVEAIPEPGFVHRSMEKLAETKLYVQNIPLFERLAINDPANMNLAYVRAVEHALSIEVPERAQYLRTIMCELSRIEAFYYDSGIFSLFFGHTTGFMYCMAIREMVIEALMQISGSRSAPSFLVPGGLRRDISDNVLDLIDNLSSAFDRRMKKFENIFVYNPVTIARAKGVGVLTKEDAIRCGMVGPFLRASGVNYDVRKIAPYDAYDKVDFEVTTGDDGDCLGRFLGRLEEIKESVKIVKQAVDAVRGIKGPILSDDVLGEYKEAASDIKGHFYRVFGNLVLPKGEWTTITEAARGTTLFTLISDGESNVPYRVRVVSPCWMNLRGFMEATKGERYADFWAVYGSFGYFPPEADR